MTDKLTNELADYVEQFLPIVAKNTMREIAIHAAQIVFSPLKQYIKTLPKEAPLDPDELHKMLEGGVAALFAPGIIFSEIVESDEFFSTIKEIRKSGVDFDRKNSYKTEISPPTAKSLVKEIGELYENPPEIELEDDLFKDHLSAIASNDSLNHFQDGMLHYRSMSLLFKIAALKQRESKLLKFPMETYQSISEAITQDLHEIVSEYVSLKTTPIEHELLSKKVKESYQRSKGRNPNPLFEDFIEWALALPENHIYERPIHAAKDFLTNSKIKYDRISEATPRTMVDKLRKHCKERNINNPFTKN